MTDIKQFKLTNDDEIICEVIQWDEPENSAMLIRAAMRIILIEDFKRGVRFYAFRPWMGFSDDPSILQTLNSAHIICEASPSDEVLKHYSGTIQKIKSALVKRDMPLDEITDKAENLSDEEFDEYLSQYLQSEEDVFDPDLFTPDSDENSNVIKFKPKGTMH